MASQPVGSLIWMSFRPMLRLVLCASTGFMITKADLLPPIAARGAGQIMLNIAFPSLFFSKIVPAFTPQNIRNLGPLVLVCLLYQLIGLLTCLAIMPFFWVPHRFRWGFIVAGIWGNYGDLPTAVIMSITAAAPFNGAEDQNLAVAYIAAFVLIFMITLFPMGGHFLIRKDFHGPEKEDDEVRRSFFEKSRESANVLVHLRRAMATCFANRRHPMRTPDVEARRTEQEKAERGNTPDRKEKDGQATSGQPCPPSIHAIPKQVAANYDEPPVAPSETDLPSRITSPLPGTTIQGDTHYFSPAAPSPDVYTNVSPPRQITRSRLFLKRAVDFFRTLLTVPTTAVVVAFIISVVQPLKGLFVPLPSSAKAPDGQPPLAFIMDTATFLGGASVPLGLICLGSALARLQVPGGEWRKLPVGAIVSLAIGRMVIQPVLGVLLVQGLTQVGIIAADDKVLRFVCMFFSCVPTATTQVYITQVYSGTGSAGHLSAFLIPQYVLMFISTTTLTAYSLHLLFG